MQSNKLSPSYTRNIIHGNAKSRTGQMFSVRIGKRQNYKQQQRKRMPLDLKSMYKIVEAGNEKEKPRDKVIRDEARRFAQTELKFTIPNISTNMNLIEEAYIRTHDLHNQVMEDLKTKFADSERDGDTVELL